MECTPPSLILPMEWGYFGLLKDRDFGIMKVER